MRLVVVAVLALASAGSALAAANVRPTLNFVPGKPIRVHGAHFTPRSVVRVFGAGSSVTKVHVTARGTFTIVVPASAEAPCAGFVLQAIGLRGERASVGIGMPSCGAAGIGDTSH